MMNVTQDLRMIGSPRDDGDDRMMDSWLRRDLARRFDGVLREKLPPDLVALLSELA